MSSSPTAELLMPYRSSTDHEAWFTLVTVHTSGWRGVKFAVEYTDSGGRRWRQPLGGSIQPIYTTEAIPVREAGRFQPRQQIRRMSPVEAWRAGGRFAEGVMPPELDEEFLEALQVPTVAMWKRIELVGEPVVASSEDTPGEVEVTVKFTPAGPPFWKDHFSNKLVEAGFRFTHGNSGGQGETQTLRCPEDSRRSFRLIGSRDAWPCSLNSATRYGESSKKNCARSRCQPRALYARIIANRGSPQSRRLLPRRWQTAAGAAGSVNQVLKYLAQGRE
jgi:hypothetical protein